MVRFLLTIHSATFAEIFVHIRSFG